MMRTLGRSTPVFAIVRYIVYSHMIMRKCTNVLYKFAVAEYVLETDASTDPAPLSPFQSGPSQRLAIHVPYV